MKFPSGSGRQTENGRTGERENERKEYVSEMGKRVPETGDSLAA